MLAPTFAVSISYMRVTLLQISLCVIMWWCVIGTAFAEGVADPTVVVKETIDEVLRLVTDDELKNPEQLPHRRILLEETIGQHFSFSEMSKRSLATHWKSRSDEERQEFVRIIPSAAFKDVCWKNRKLFRRRSKVPQGTAKKFLCRSPDQDHFSLKRKFPSTIDCY